MKSHSRQGEDGEKLSDIDDIHLFTDRFGTIWLIGKSIPVIYGLSQEPQFWHENYLKAYLLINYKNRNILKINGWRKKKGPSCSPLKTQKDERGQMCIHNLWI